MAGCQPKRKVIDCLELVESVRIVTIMYEPEHSNSVEFKWNVQETFLF